MDCWKSLPTRRGYGGFHHRRLGKSWTGVSGEIWPLRDIQLKKGEFSLSELNPRDERDGRESNSGADSSDPGASESSSGGIPEQGPQKSGGGGRRREGGVCMYQMYLYRPSTRSCLQLRRVSESRLDLLRILREEYPDWQVRRVRIHDIG